MYCKHDGLNDWIQTALNHENVTKFNITNKRNAAVGGGYISEIFFVEVSAEKHDKKEADYNFVVKLSTKEFQHICRKELFIYNNVVPEFQRFIPKRNDFDLNFLPKCYAAIIEESRDIIILDDVTKLGFKLRDRWKSMSYNTIKEIVKTYGKLHALTFALREKYPSKYGTLKEGFKKSNPIGGFWNGPFYKKLLDFAERCVYETLTELKEIKLLDRFKEKIGSFDEAMKMFYFYGNENQLVFTHGDCWNNNYLFNFKEEDKNEENPDKVIFIDFQLSELQSPAIDLGHFLYSNASITELSKLKDILKVYHLSFSDTLTQFECPGHLFPFSELISHWCKYSGLTAVIGLIAINMVLKDNPELDVMTADYKDFTHIKHKEEFETRMLGIVRHCLDSKFD